MNKFAEMSTKELSENQHMIFNLGRCAACGADALSVEKTTRPVRRIKCGRCGCAYKSIEIFLLYEGALSAADRLREEKRALKECVGYL